MIASVLIDTYNHAAFIEQAVESALEQDVSRDTYEVIVVDDGSTDNTAEVLKRFSSDITYIRQENGGQAKAFNTGIAQAQGEYIFFLDADDYCFPSRLNKVIEEFEKYPEVVYILNNRKILLPDEVRFDTFPALHNIALNETTAEQIALLGYGTSRAAIRASTLRKLGPIPEISRIGADIYFHAALWYGRFSCLDEILTAYRVHENNLFHAGSIEALNIQIECLERYIPEMLTAAKRAPGFNPDIAEVAIRPFTLLLQEFRYQHALVNGTATSKMFFEIKKLRYQLRRSQWSTAYRFYQGLHLALIALLPHSLLARIRKKYVGESIQRLDSTQ